VEEFDEATCKQLLSLLEEILSKSYYTCGGEISCHYTNPKGI